MPPKEALWAGLYSYHGGKNSWIGKQGWYKAYDLDIRSAFPEAMLNMPNFSNGTWQRVKYVTEYSGFYLIEGTALPCPWGSLFSHSFKKLQGNFSNTWVTSYELLEAIRSQELG